MVAERVRELREQRGWNQSELAARAGLHPSTINKIESGRSRQLSAEVAIALASVLEITADELLKAGNGTTIDAIEADLEAISQVVKEYPTIRRLIARRIRKIREEFEDYSESAS